ncbi:MAG: hypothetical protein ACI9OJ_001202 [Myxococcota bacterium]|jgi:hypothetical protein
MTDACGQFIARDQIEPDVLGSTGYLAGPIGAKASVWDLEERLDLGLQRLLIHGLERGDNQEVDGPSALAYLSAMRFSELIWEHVVGRPLTTPHGFPRNREQRDLLSHLTETFIGSNYSLKTLLVTVLTQSILNQDLAGNCSAPEAIETAYYMPPVFDPWIIEDEDLARRGNGLGDGVVRLPGWAAVGAATNALGWAPVSEFYLPTEGVLNDLSAASRFLQDIGIAVDDVPGGRDSNFAERLAWEEAFGECRSPYPVWAESDGITTEPPPADFIDELAQIPSGTVEDAMIALKDRILNEPVLADPSERDLMEKLSGLSLSASVRR